MNINPAAFVSSICAAAGLVGLILLVAYVRQERRR